MTTTINFNAYRNTAYEHLNDENFKTSSEHVMKMASILLHRHMVLVDVRNGRYDFRGSAERVFFLREEAEYKFNCSVNAFYKGIIWLNSQCKAAGNGSLLNVYLTKDNEEDVLQVAKDFVAAVSNY